jgi:hypothetical protein
VVNVTEVLACGRPQKTAVFRDLLGHLLAVRSLDHLLAVANLRYPLAVASAK